MDVEGKVVILLGREADTHSIHSIVGIRRHAVAILEDIVSR